MSKVQPINHEARDFKEALGFSLEEVEIKANNVLKMLQEDNETGKHTPSRAVEILENNLIPRELAFILLNQISRIG